MPVQNRQADYLSGNLLSVSGNAKVAFGSGILTWPGGTSLSNVFTVAHGLGVAPSAILLTLNSTGVGQSFAFVTASGVANFSGAAYAPGLTPGLGTNQTYYWVAIG